MQIEDFIRFLAQAVAQHVAAAPPKQFVVNRVDDHGKPVQQTTTLPQLMAEQNDLLKATGILQTETNRNYVEMIETAKELSEALDENSHIAKRALKRQEGG